MTEELSGDVRLDGTVGQAKVEKADFGVVFGGDHALECGTAYSKLYSTDDSSSADGGGPNVTGTVADVRQHGMRAACFHDDIASFKDQCGLRY